jgi:hypothetical protein
VPRLLAERDRLRLELVLPVVILERPSALPVWGADGRFRVLVCVQSATRVRASGPPNGAYFVSLEASLFMTLP